MSSEQFEEELREVTIVVRSLITSTKPPVSLSNIERDYLNVEMRPIPFRRLGFRNTLELLQETNAFDFQKYGNDIIVRAKPNPKSAHIASMVRHQKSSGKNKISAICRTQTPAVKIIRTVSNINAQGNGQQAALKAAQQQQAAQQAAQKAAQQKAAQQKAAQQKAAQQQAAQKAAQQKAAQQQAAQQKAAQQQAAQQAAQKAVHKPITQQQAGKLLAQLAAQKVSTNPRPQTSSPVRNVKPVGNTNAQSIQGQQAAQLEAQEKKLQALLNKELARLRGQLEEQQKVLLQQHKKQEDQQRKTDRQIIELQQKHELGLKVQVDTIEKLKKERLELQRLLKQQELRDKPTEQQSKQQLEESVAKAIAHSQLSQQESQPRKTKDEVKVEANPPLTSSALVSASAKLAAMNGNAAAAARKPHLRPILGNSAPQRPAPMQHPTAMTDSPTGAAGMAAGKRQQYPRVQYPGARSTSGISVNYRLKQQQTAVVGASQPTASPAAPLIITPPDSPESAASNKNSPAQAEAAVATKPEQKQVSEKQPLKQTASQIVNFKFDPGCDAITLLKQYCAAQGYAPPEYEFTQVLKSNRMHCKVHIGSNIYTSYPEEHTDEASAKQRTAEITVERLKQLQSREKLKQLGDAAFLDSLYQELVKHPHGIVSHKLAEWYEATVKRQVPINFWDLINGSPKIRIESSINTNIVFANTTTEAALSHSSSSSITNLVTPPQQQLLLQSQPTYIAETSSVPELQLPWVDGQQDWSMYITHCDSTMHVWACLIDQSSNFEKLTEQLNAHMSSRTQNRQAASLPIEHKIYLVEVSENWNRVRVQSTDPEQRQCICHFIDFGDEVIFGYDSLYECPSQFLALPAQAVCLSMYALDKFEDHPHAQPVLAKELAGHSVVTRIITSEMQFHKLGGRTQGVLVPQQVSPEQSEQTGVQPSVRRACIVGTFYDTSTAEDIHLNDLVANRIIRSTPAPMLKLDQKSNHVLVSHVNDVGDLMVLIPNEDLKFVQRSIARIMSDASEQHRVGYTDLLHDQLVCVCDETGDGGKQWYRGMLTAKPKSAEEEVFDVYYVDDGRLRKTHISNIYRLEANNLALASYPAQALRVRLHDVPPIDNQMVGRLRGLLSPQTPVLLKVMEGANDKLPMVTIHARGQDSLYLCLNSAIRMEYEVQSTTRLEPFDDGGLHFSPTGQLIRRGSFSSTVSSHSNSSDPSTTAIGIVSPPTTPRKTPSLTAPATTLLPQLKEYEAIPAIGAYFEVRVALSVNPGHFAVQPYKYYNQLQRMMKDLQAHCKSSAAQKVLPAQLAIGQAFAAAESDGVYHRVNIRKIYDEMIHVRYVDAGDDGVVPCNQLLQLTQEFRELPMMALPAQLHGIQLDGIDWTKENCVRFRELTLGQKFIGIVRRVDKLKDDRRALSLELIDTSTPQDIKVHETLISEKHALASP